MLQTPVCHCFYCLQHPRLDSRSWPCCAYAGWRKHCRSLPPDGQHDFMQRCCFAWFRVLADFYALQDAFLHSQNFMKLRASDYACACSSTNVSYGWLDRVCFDGVIEELRFSLASGSLLLLASLDLHPLLPYFILLFALVKLLAFGRRPQSHTSFLPLRLHPDWIRSILGYLTFFLIYFEGVHLVQALLKTCRIKTHWFRH